MEEIKDIKDIKYGLIAVDELEEGEFMTILHFVGFWNQPTEEDRLAILEELKTDEEFGLTELKDSLCVLYAPDNIVEYYKGKIEDEE